MPRRSGDSSSRDGGPAPTWKTTSPVPKYTGRRTIATSCPPGRSSAAFTVTVALPARVRPPETLAAAPRMAPDRPIGPIANRARGNDRWNAPTSTWPSARATVVAPSAATPTDAAPLISYPATWIVRSPDPDASPPPPTASVSEPPTRASPTAVAAVPAIVPVYPEACQMSAPAAASRMSAPISARPPAIVTCSAPASISNVSDPLRRSAPSRAGVASGTATATRK